MLLDPIKLMPPELVPYAQDIDAFTATTRVRLLWPPIGVGGGGTVVAAQDQRGADLAIKIILADTDAMRDQVKREANILKQVQHAAALSGQGVLWQKHYPHVDLFFLAMELVEGQTLAAYLDANGTLDEATALEWTIAIAEGLEAMHRQKIIHRDIKPENIILAQLGSRYQPILVDYGIAKVGNHTARGAKAATDGYAPPEQYRGGTDQRSDIYALGATLFEMVTGRTPPKATKRDVKAVLEPRQFNARISPELEVVIQIATACDPDQRFHTMGALLDALRLVESNDTVALYTILQTLGLVQMSGQRVQPVSVSRAISAPQLPPLPLKKATPKVTPVSPPTPQPPVLAPGQAAVLPPAPVSLSKGGKGVICSYCHATAGAGELFCPDCGWALVAGVPVGVAKSVMSVLPAPTVKASVLAVSPQGLASGAAGFSSSGAAGAAVSQYPKANLEYHLWEVWACRPITLGAQPISSAGMFVLCVFYLCWYGFALLTIEFGWWALSGHVELLIFIFTSIWAVLFLVRFPHTSVYRRGQMGAFARGALLFFVSLLVLILVVVFCASLLPFVPWPLGISRTWFDFVAGSLVSLLCYWGIQVGLS